MAAGRVTVDLSQINWHLLRPHCLRSPSCRIPSP